MSDPGSGTTNPGETRDEIGPRQNHDVHVVASSAPFIVCLVLLSSVYLLLVALMILADIGVLIFSGGGIDALLSALRSENVRYATFLSLISSSITTVLSLFVAVPIGYLMSRFDFRGKACIDALLDIPIVLPPMVVGISLLVLFNLVPEELSNLVVYEVPAVILAQFAVACAFAVRTMRVTFDQISQRYEQVALTLGASRGQVFWTVVMPQTKRGLLAAGTLAWARSLGEFGPVLVFAGSSPRTEVLPTTVYLAMQSGDLLGMLAVSMIMIVLAAIVLIITRVFGLRRLNA